VRAFAADARSTENKGEILLFRSGGSKKKNFPFVFSDVCEVALDARPRRHQVLGVLCLPGRWEATAEHGETVVQSLHRYFL
jgi:hypothetical protein